MPLSWNEIKSRAIALAAAPVSMARAMEMATVAGRLPIRRNANESLCKC